MSATSCSPPRRQSARPSATWVSRDARPVTPEAGTEPLRTVGDGTRIPLAHLAEVVDERVRRLDPEVDAQHADVDRDRLDAVGAREQDAVVVVDGFDHADRCVDAGQDLTRGGPHVDARVHDPTGRRDRAQDEVGVLALLERLRDEPATVSRSQGHPVEAVDRPVTRSGVSGHEVPAAFPAHQAVGLHQRALVVLVEAQQLGIADRGGDRAERRGIDLGVLDIRAGVLGPTGHGGLDGRDLAVQTVRKHLLELREGAGGGLLDARDACCHPQRDREADGFLVVEEQRRELRTGAQPVVTRRPALGVDGVAERAQALDVVADRAGAHLEPLGQLGSRPGRSGLQEGQQREQPCGGFQHG